VYDTGRSTHGANLFRNENPVGTGLSLRKKHELICPFGASRKAPKTKTAQRTTQIAGKKRIFETEKIAFGFIRGLGYNLLEDWVGSLFYKRFWLFLKLFSETLLHALK
jgi:hypothetical protein